MRVMGQRGMVSTPHYAATESGLRMLRAGGTAIDAAIAANAVLSVVKPFACGLGGDLFALVHTPADGPVGLNASGRAFANATPERVRSLAGSETMPQRGPLPVTVPGCVDGWEQLHRRWGRLPWPDLFTDALTYASEGFPVSKEMEQALAAAQDFLHPDTPARETFLPGGHPPAEGEILRQPRLAASLTEIRDHGARPIYHGSLAAEIVRSLVRLGGLIEPDDLARHHSDWVTPLRADYRGVDVYELPPNSQGVVALLMLQILAALPPEKLQWATVDWIHLLAQAARLAYADRDAHLTDPDQMAIDITTILTPTYGAEHAGHISERALPLDTPGDRGDTAYLCAADAEGTLVSLIQSNYLGIGSGVMAGETGIMLQNRGAQFSLDPSHVNVIAPGKRTMHTLMPALATRAGRPWLVFGTMGGSMQPQIHVQILSRLLDQRMAIDDALAAPRFDAVPPAGGLAGLEIEDRFDSVLVQALRERGYSVLLTGPYSSNMGHAQAIMVLDNGVYAGAADPRTDGLALGY